MSTFNRIPTKSSRLLTAVAVAGLCFLAASPARARVQVYFTARGDDAPGVIIKAMQAAERRAEEGRPATIDAAISAFTHFGIADEMLRIAAEQPTVQVRLILDLGQISHSEFHVGPYIEDVQHGGYADACSLRYAGKPAATQASCQADLKTRFGGNKLPNVQVNTSGTTVTSGTARWAGRASSTPGRC
jgi:hypothetical protein